MIMATKITVEVDEDRLRQAGLSTAAEDIMTELAGLREGRLSLQTRDHWLPVRNLTVPLSGVRRTRDAPGS
jgi:hypothetical protein